MVRFDVLEPCTLREACSLLSEHKDVAKFIAGGGRTCPFCSGNAESVPDF